MFVLEKFTCQKANYLLSNSACQHKRCNLERRKSEMEVITLLHDVHIEQVLHVSLLYCNQQLFLATLTKSVYA